MHSVIETIGQASDSVLAVIVKENMVLRGLRHYSSSLALWTAPGGRCNPGETFESALHREVYEEIGVTNLIIQDFIGSAPGWQTGDTVHLFLCTTDQGVKLMEPEKFSEWRWVPIEEYITGECANRINKAHMLVSEYLLRMRDK